MRDLNNIKAEIYRRSENRIKERKKRNRLIMSGSLTFCLAVFLSLSAFPDIYDSAFDMEEAPHFTTGTATDAEKNEFCQSTELLGCGATLHINGVFAQLTTSKDVEKLVNLLDDLLYSPEVEPDKQPEYDQPKEDEDISLETSNDAEAEISESEKDTSQDGCDEQNPAIEESEALEESGNVDFEEELVTDYIYVLLPNGTELYFTYSDNILTNQATGQQWYLTESELEAIFSAFGK